MCFMIGGCFFSFWREFSICVLFFLVLVFCFIGGISHFVCWGDFSICVFFCFFFCWGDFSICSLFDLFSVLLKGIYHFCCLLKRFPICVLCLFELFVEGVPQYIVFRVFVDCFWFVYLIEGIDHFLFVEGIAQYVFYVVFIIFVFCWDFSICVFLCFVVICFI